MRGQNRTVYVNLLIDILCARSRYLGSDPIAWGPLSIRLSQHCHSASLFSTTIDKMIVADGLTWQLRSQLNFST